MVKINNEQHNPTYTRVINEVVEREGWTLESLSNETPILVVFLRHLGCIYCRESLSELRRLRTQIEANDVRIVLVHMGSDSEARNLLAAFGLDDLIRFSDPERRLYDAFGLERTTMSRLLAPTSVVSMIKAGIRSEIPLRRAMGRVVGDALQMPGVFLLHKGRIADDYRPENLSQRPDYLELAALEC
jgi:peroxiredoxin